MSYRKAYNCDPVYTCMARYSDDRCTECGGKELLRDDGSVWCPNCAQFRPVGPGP